MGKFTVMKKMIIFDQHFGILIVVLWAISPDEKQELITWANETIITKEIIENLIDDNIWCQ
ncbi:MAG: hypothetical protein ACK51L_02845 [bacterium]